MTRALNHEAQKRHDARPWLLLIAAVVIVLDRITKIAVVKHVPMGSGIDVIPHVFRITHVLNTGAAFSMFADSASPATVRFALVVFSVVVAGLIVAMLWRYGRTWSMNSVGFALVLGGAIGNLYDRAVLHSVVDFLEVHIVNYHWPDFNVADSAITVGAVLLVSEMIWPKKAAQVEEENATGAGEFRGA